MGKDKEWDFLDAVSTRIFTALITMQGKDGNYEDLSTQAWKLADIHLKARKELKLNRYNEILEGYKGVEALRRILKLDGNGGQVIDFIINQYADKPDPLLEYAKDNTGPRTAGQIAVTRYFEKHGKDAQG